MRSDEKSELISLSLLSMSFNERKAFKCEAVDRLDSKKEKLPLSNAGKSGNIFYAVCIRLLFRCDFM